MRGSNLGSVAILVLFAGCSSAGVLTAGERPVGQEPDPPEEPCADADADTVCDLDDNCLDLPNEAQADDDGDGLGDLCEPTAFEVRVIDAGVIPVKADSSPWDFSGDVPDQLITLGGLIGVFWPTAQTFTQVLEFTDTVAPELLEGTVPPDPYVRITLLGADGEVLEDFGRTAHDDDTVEPAWQRSVRTELLPGELLCFDVYDHDLIDDDPIGGACHTLETLQRFERAGPFDLTPEDVDMGQVFRFGFQVEPLEP